jgi:hypothetical protein
MIGMRDPELEKRLKNLACVEIQTQALADLK